MLLCKPPFFFLNSRLLCRLIPIWVGTGCFATASSWRALLGPFGPPNKIQKKKIVCQTATQFRKSPFFIKPHTRHLTSQLYTHSENTQSRDYTYGLYEAELNFERSRSVLRRRSWSHLHGVLSNSNRGHTATDRAGSALGVRSRVPVTETAYTPTTLVHRCSCRGHARTSGRPALVLHVTHKL